MIRVGVLGAGFMGSTHARAFAKLPDVQVVAVTSRTLAKAAALAQEVGARASLDHMAVATDPNIDVISNTLPTPFHQEYTIAALQTGKAVLLEKPMGLTLEECDAMIAAARAAGRPFMIAHVIRFWPEYVAMYELVASGALGKPLAAVARRLSTRPTWGDWFANAAWTGGAVLDLHIHDLDTLNWFFGRPRTVYARGQRGMSGGWDHVLTLVDYGAVTAHAEGSVMMPEGYPFTMSLAVLCERGSVEFDFRAGGTGVETGAAEGTRLRVYESGQPPRVLPASGGDAYAAEVAYFVECVRTNRLPERGTPEQARMAVQTALAARRSLETDQVVTL
ncbi:MAG: Gfo/Idh/MocA family oxidoreductase [Anaerolineae bacterium]|nr:Gfo/Idh/MocA family oxidoreductase [Anaerolineae bacterium]MDW8069904.1 Gfo/Idh/MocA family oxidoreductase [Anaerolineae bacterium]